MGEESLSGTFLYPSQPHITSLLVAGPSRTVLPWQFIKGTYPWSLLFLIPVGLAIATIVWECASPLLRRRRRKKTVAKTD